MLTWLTGQALRKFGIGQGTALGNASLNLSNSEIPKCVTPDLVSLHELGRPQQPAVDGVGQRVCQLCINARLDEAKVSSSGCIFVRGNLTKNSLPIQPRRSASWIEVVPVARPRIITRHGIKPSPMRIEMNVPAQDARMAFELDQHRTETALK